MAFANLGELGNAFITIDVDHRGFGRDLGQAEAAFRDSARRMAVSMEAAGRTMVASGLAITAAFGATIKVASDFESAFAGVRKTVDASEEEFKALSDGISRMSEEIPVGRNELAGIMEVAGQLGVTGVDNLLAFTRTAADLGATTNLSSEEASTALARFINVTGGSFDAVDRLGSVVVSLGNNFATTESEILNMAQRLSGLAPAAGFTQQQILALSASLSSVGVEAELGGTAVQRLVINMVQAASEGGEALDEFARVAGMTGNQFSELVRNDPSEALRAFFSGINDINQAGGDLFGTLENLGISEQRLIQVITKAAGAQQLFADANVMANQAFDENTALTNEANQRYETFASQVTIAKNAFLNLVGELGTPAMEALSSVLQESVIPAIRQTVTAVAAWIDKNPELAGKILLAVGALGALLVAVGTLLIALAPLVAALAVVGPAFLAVGAGIMAGVVAAFGILSVATDEMKARLQEFMAFLINVFTGNWDAAWINMQNVAASVWAAVESGFGSLVDFMVGAIKKLLGWLDELVEKFGNLIPGGFGAIADLGIGFLRQQIGDVSNLASGGAILQSGIVDIHANERVFLPEGARVQKGSDVDRGDSGSSPRNIISLTINGPVGIDDIVGVLDAELSRKQDRRSRAMGVALP